MLREEPLPHGRPQAVVLREDARQQLGKALAVNDGLQPSCLGGADRDPEPVCPAGQGRRGRRLVHVYLSGPVNARDFMFCHILVTLRPIS